MQPPPPVNATRLKTTLKMAISKLKFLQEKKTALTKQQRRQLADLMGAGKETSAKIRVENIIRDDIYVELLEYCELYCELLLARILLVLDLQRTRPDGGLQEAVALIVFCCSHTEIKELVALGDMLRMRYGPEYSREVMENAAGVVPAKIVTRCDIEPPLETLVDLYLSEIARAYGVGYLRMVRGDSDSDDDGPAPQVKELEEPLAESVKEAIAEKKSVKEPSEFDLLRERFAALKR